MCPLIRCHTSFFNYFNFILLLLICIVRTSYELSLLALRHLWTGLDLANCGRVVIVLLMQLQVISLLIAVLLFQNVILVALANRIYLCKSFASSLKAVDNAARIQTLLAFVLPILSGLIVARGGATNSETDCWPVNVHLDAAQFFWRASLGFQAFMVS